MGSPVPMPRRPDAPSDPARRVGLFVLRGRATHMSRVNQHMTSLARVGHQYTLPWVRRIWDIVGHARNCGWSLTQEYPPRLARNTFADSRENLSANLGGTSFAAIIVGMDMGSLSAASMPQPRKVGPDAPPPAPRASGFFMLRHCDLFHPY